MDCAADIERFFEALIAGDRPAARAIVTNLRGSGQSAESLIAGLFWPTYENVDRLFRADQLATLNYHMAVRLLRVLVDQNAAGVSREDARGRSIFAVCGSTLCDELGAQMALDLLEGAGFDVRFGGSRVANDEILAQVNGTHPDVLLLFATGPNDLPDFRALIDTLHQIGACPALQIAVGGGVFNRADGLAEEIGADVWADSPMSIVHALINRPMQRARQDQRTVGRGRRNRKAA